MTIKKEYDYTLSNWERAIPVCDGSGTVLLSFRWVGGEPYSIIMGEKRATEFAQEILDTIKKSKEKTPA